MQIAIGGTEQTMVEGDKQRYIQIQQAKLTEGTRDRVQSVNMREI